MGKDFAQLTWTDSVLATWMEILELAFIEDIGDDGDLTSNALIPEDAMGAADIVARQAGVLAGEPAIGPTLGRFQPPLKWTAAMSDGDAFDRGQVVGRIEGSARDILTAERIVLNYLGRMAGIATLTKSYVEAVQGTNARIYDTRKTTPGWRCLEKYAVRCGGGWNHRQGLFQAILIKDNHLALGKVLSENDSQGYSPAEAVAKCEQYIRQSFSSRAESILIEVEVDTLDQLAEVLPAQPDIVLLDNMAPELLSQSVALRYRTAPSVELEASGGVNLASVRNIALSGIDRISIGALTHSAIGIDFGLDWR